MQGEDEGLEAAYEDANGEYDDGLADYEVEDDEDDLEDEGYEDWLENEEL